MQKPEIFLPSARDDLGKWAAATLRRHSQSWEEGLWWRGLDSKWAGHTKVTMLLCILKRPGDGPRVGGGVGEGIYSTVKRED